MNASELRVFSDSVVRFLRLGGFPEEDAKAFAAAVMQTVLTTFSPWYGSLAPALKQKKLIAARSKVWAGGLVLVRVDCSPGRLVVLCCELWKMLQDATFVQNSRYSTVDLPPAAFDVTYAKRVRESLETVAGAGSWVGRSPTGRQELQ